MATVTWARGQTFYGPTGFGSNIVSTDLKEVQLEGLELEFDDIDPATGEVRSGQRVKGRIVRNSSGIALLPGTLVQWATGYRNRRVGGYANVSYAESAGFVDDQISGTVRANDLFFLVQEGPTRQYTPHAGVAGNECSAGSLLYAGTMENSTGNATSTRGGHLQVWDGEFNLTDVTTAPNSTKVLHVARNVVAVAVSAVTSGETNTLKNVIACIKA